VESTLDTLLRFLNWIPLGYVFETKLINTLICKVSCDNYCCCNAVLGVQVLFSSGLFFEVMQCIHFKKGQQDVLTPPSWPHYKERPVISQPQRGRCLRADAGQTTLEVIGSKQSYALKWCKPNNDDDDDTFQIECWSMMFGYIHWILQRVCKNFANLMNISLLFNEY